MRARAVVLAGATAIGAALCSVTAGCARPGAPTGGVRDLRPPVVIATEPAGGATVSDRNAVVRFRFNERISERVRQGLLDEAVLVSPRGGAVHVKHGSDQLEVRVDGGLRPNTVYRFILLPVVTDLFGNVMRDPFELVVSTGAPLVENALAGQVVDRITGRPVPNADVQLLPRTPVADTLAHLARTDANGLYAFRFIPEGQYQLVAFQDRNRDLRPNRGREPIGVRTILMSARDTAFYDLAMIEPDTTAAQLSRADVVDSTTLRLTFDDFLDPDPGDIRRVAVSVAAPAGEPAPGVLGVFHPVVWQARLDSIARAANPSAAARPESLLPRAGQERGGLPRDLPLPRQDLIVSMSAPLAVGVEYKVVSTGLVNIAGVPNGRGEATVTRPKPTVPPGAAAPAAPARPDSAAAPAVPAAAPLDSTAAPPPSAAPSPLPAPGR